MPTVFVSSTEIEQWTPSPLTECLAVLNALNSSQCFMDWYVLSALNMKLDDHYEFDAFRTGFLCVSLHMHFIYNSTDGLCADDIWWILPDVLSISTGIWYASETFCGRFVAIELLLLSFYSFWMILTRLRFLFQFIQLIWFFGFSNIFYFVSVSLWRSEALSMV